MEFMTYYEVFKALGNTRSRNGKIDILKQADMVTRDILQATYDSFKHYFINKVPKRTSGSGLLSLYEANWTTILQQLQKRILSGNKALQRVSNFMGTLKEEDAKIFGRILKKNQRCGIGAQTINLAIPDLIPSFGAMLAKKWNLGRYKSNLMMSLKYDGVRAIYKNGRLYTRNGHEIQGVEHITSVLPNSWSFDGELMIPDMRFQESSGIIRRQANSAKAEYYVFDIPESGAPFITRYSMYQKLLTKLGHPQMHAVKHVAVVNLDHIYTTFHKALSQGYEGLVIKEKNHLYKTRRGWAWMKLKAENSEDLQISGFFEGEGKYKNQMGGIEVIRSNNVKVRVGSGFTDAERQNIWANKDDYIGKLVEIKYHEETPDGSLRHPVFKSFRYDKNEVN